MNSLHPEHLREGNQKVPSESSLPELIVYFGRWVLKLHPRLECPGNNCRESEAGRAHAFRAAGGSQAHSAGRFLCQQATAPSMPGGDQARDFSPLTAHLKRWRIFRNPSSDSREEGIRRLVVVFFKALPMILMCSQG